MASAHWRTGHTVGSLLQQKDAGWEFLPLVNMLSHILGNEEQNTSDGISDEKRLAQLTGQIIFRASLAADYPPSDVRHVAITAAQKKADVVTASGGLMTPDGPLPDVFIEWLRDLSRRRDFAMIDFLDLFNNRLLALRYLLGQSTRPTLIEGPADSSCSGQFMRALGGKLIENQSGQYDLGLTGLFANVRLSLPLVRQLVKVSLDLPLQQMKSCVGGWMKVDEQDYSRLGDAQNSRLGQGATLGRRVWDQQQSMELVMGPVAWKRVGRLLPDGDQYAQLTGLIKRITDGRIDCRVTLRVPATQIPGLYLNYCVRQDQASMTLGISAFLFPRPDDQGLVDISFTTGAAA